ncbi:helix-turn-helix domain containing protein [Saccharopolyspora sp. WRP15-2]|uniref:Helix-turn-helix domain containing protein n=1 Tax=Saccharopolyspora oryzae TaxID=2997343 RepID=A0ABT4UZ14_9PSEU|nr:TetR/AcrR family transcriptional regulator [Saccharopolyspora oryzae]MDA3626950.1 helix-turn-helix domain containing protein [Saccharopolyspora oryzae]
MARKALDQDELLVISRRCAAVFADAGDSSPTVARLAEAAGMSQRSFYRYFPTKEECLRPLFDGGSRAFTDALAAQPPGTALADAMLRAFDLTYSTSSDEEARALMAVVFADAVLRRVWLQATYEITELLRPSVAALLGTPADDLRTTAVCGQAALLNIVALEHSIRDETPLADTARAAAAALFGPLSQPRTATPHDAARTTTK